MRDASWDEFYTDPADVDDEFGHWGLGDDTPACHVIDPKKMA